MKKLIIILFLLIIGAFAYYFSKIRNQYRPYPYSISYPKTEIKKLYEDRPVQILIVGDRMAQKLGQQMHLLSHQLSLDLKEPINIGVMAYENEGLHRTFARLKSLDKLPQIIIYHGASKEEFEYKFNTNYLTELKFNFQRFNDPYWRTLVYFSPMFSKVTYLPMKHIPLRSDKIKTTEQLPQSSIQMRTEVYYKIFEFELDEMLSWLKSQGSFPIVLTTPVNFDVRPHSTCKNAISDQLNQELKEIKELLKKNDFKLAYNKMREIVSIYPGNANLHYSLATIAKNLNLREIALHNFKIASALDCERWRANSVYNQIIRKVARKNETVLFDFAKLTQDAWPDNITFIDEIYPQPLFYQKAINYLSKQLKQIFHL